MGQVMTTLQWGVLATDLDVVQSSLEALAALACFLASVISAGHQADPHIAGGVPPHLTSGKKVGGRLCLQSLLSRRHLNPALDEVAGGRCTCSDSAGHFYIGQ